ncbi:epithelial cell-transforming sequence 2 oncogene-like isoform X1 [Nelusetta ayraudi]|uniref:epithelial cell-transforming sequence 2 oncogene-like isoform X1 n=1 Tax=Nelusetta ayraudi TaxID=303726 RepID=UPI003F71B02A
MEPSWSAGAPHSVKRWQLAGTDYQPAAGECSLPSGKQFSSWTPLGHKEANQQLFEERVNLLLRWFDLWSDRQRKHLLRHLLARCSVPQLKLCRDLLMEAVPVTRVDFTSVLPRFLSLYVMSFLSPRDLCSAAQVCWHWRFLAEQDCVWASRCLRRGWFLPYVPAEKEFGAWKSHYASCLASLDWLTPREAARTYGTLNQASAGPAEEAEERRKERRIRQMIREKLQEEKRELLRSRRPWGSSAKLGGARGDGAQTGRPASGGMFSSWPSLSGPPRSAGFPTSCLSLDRAASRSLEGVQSPGRRHNHASPALSSFTCSPAPPSPAPRVHLPHPPLLLLVSNRIPAHELLLGGVKAAVLVVLYDHRETLASLLTQAESALCGRTVQRLGFLAPGGTQDVHVLQSSVLSERTLLTPDHREFWEKLSGWVEPGEDGGVDIFCPLGASLSGLTLMRTLSTLSGLQVRAPLGFATGSFQNILGEWCDSSMRVGPANPHLVTAPAVRYIWDGVLQAWCRQAQWMEEALGELRPQLGPRLQGVGLLARGRALGRFLLEKIGLEEPRVSANVTQALAQGLAALNRQEEARPLQFLATFLTRWPEERSEPPPSEGDLCRIPELPQMVVDWRGALVKELHHSESVYLARLGAVLKVYQEPLAAALASNRAILSFTDLQLILSPVEQLLELNRLFLVDLEARLQRWSPDGCVGDVFVKLCSRLPVYSNYLNNYSTALHTVDKCREAKPLFRAFLKRVDRTLATHTMRQCLTHRHTHTHSCNHTHTHLCCL